LRRPEVRMLLTGSGMRRGQEMAGGVLTLHSSVQPFRYGSPPLRLEFRGIVYEVTACGNGRQPIVADDMDRPGFVDPVRQGPLPSAGGLSAVCARGPEGTLHGGVRAPSNPAG